MNELQEIEYGVLKKTVAFLNENHIRYWLAYGTALGAVRHKGFIPWDDDIDVYIDGKDYDRLRKCFLQNHPDGIALHDFTTVKNYPYTFPKIVDINTGLIESRYDHLDYECGVYIDIFPLFEAPAHSISRKIDCFLRYFDYIIIEAKYSKHILTDGFFKKILIHMLRLFSPYKAQKRLSRRCEAGIISGDAYLFGPLDFTEDTKLDSGWFSSSQLCRFEDENFLLPNSAEEYLKKIYGNFMQYPPVEERVAVHNFKYWKKQ